ncbi:hypothetical protein Bbelb_359910 [Branchiostoma belcheri]|nr:hypothetical protein Bbelb_359910 [Branchiostoma belcheri]
MAATDPAQTPKIHSNSNKNGTEIRFPLGGNVYATAGYFKKKVELSLCYFYRTLLRPNRKLKGSTRTRVFLTPKQWRTLKLNMSEVSAALQACASAATCMPDDATPFSPRRFHLGNLTYGIVQVSRGETVVRLQEYFQRRPEFRRGPDDDPDDLLPGRRWLNLSADQWNELEAHSQKIDTVLEATENTVSLTDKLVSDIVGCNVMS